MTADTIIPYAVNVPESELEDLQLRLRMARLPDAVANAGWDYGVPSGYVEELVAYWRDSYDWAVHAARLNEHPQFLTTIDARTALTPAMRSIS